MATYSNSSNRVFDVLMYLLKFDFEPVHDYSKFLNGCHSGSACPWRVGTCQWRVDGDRRLSYWMDLLGVIRKIERRLNYVNVRSGFSQWERRWNPSSTWNYVSTRKQQNTLQLTTIKKFAIQLYSCRCLLFLRFFLRLYYWFMARAWYILSNHLLILN